MSCDIFTGFRPLLLNFGIFLFLISSCPPVICYWAERGGAGHVMSLSSTTPANLFIDDDLTWPTYRKLMSHKMINHSALSVCKL